MARLEFEKELMERPSEALILYMYSEASAPNLAKSVKQGDTVLTVSDTGGVEIGHAINLHDDDNHYQSIVVGKDDESITLASPVDVGFGTDTVVHSGLWQCNVDGSAEPVVFQVHPPTNKVYDIYSIVISITSEDKMGCELFGSLDSLGNGILFRKRDGDYKNYFLIVNNIGMGEQGFEVGYKDKISNQYGLRAKNNVEEHTGTHIRLLPDEALELYIQDDLTGLSHMSVTIGGHIYENNGS